MGPRDTASCARFKQSWRPARSKAEPSPFPCRLVHPSHRLRAPGSGLPAEAGEHHPTAAEAGFTRLHATRREPAAPSPSRYLSRVASWDGWGPVGTTIEMHLALHPCLLMTRNGATLSKLSMQIRWFGSTSLQWQKHNVFSVPPFLIILSLMESTRAKLLAGAVTRVSDKLQKKK